MTTRRTKQRGVALVVVALFLGLLLAFAAIGIDVGRLAHVATEVQTVADAAARGGAKALSDVGGTPGVGITRARFVAGKNNMNGGIAPAADVLVDEGLYDFGSRKFGCCTSNTPCCSSGSWGGLTCTRAAACDSRMAVIAVPRTNVHNLLAGIFDFFQDGRLTSTEHGGSSDTTQVQKLAVAAGTGPATGCRVPDGCAANNWGCYCDHGVVPCLPIAAASCEFPPACTGVACQLPNLRVGSSTSDTAGWTGYSLSADSNTVRSYLAQGPCDPPGQDRTVPPQDVGGPDINLTNGINSTSLTNVFGLTQCLAGLGSPPRNQPQGCAIDASGNIIPGRRGNVFAMPIFDAQSGASCTGNFNHSHPIVGFATIQITAVTLSSSPTISIHTVRNASSTDAPPGGGCFGTDCRIMLVR